MREETSFAPGWLRLEIASAIENFTKQPYVSQEVATDLKQAARSLDDSNRFRRPSVPQKVVEQGR